MTAMQPPDGAVGVAQRVSGIVDKVLNPRVTGRLNPLSDEEVKVSLRPNLPGSRQKLKFTFPFQDGGLVDSDLNMDEIELSQEEQDLLRMVVVALSEDSDLSNEERNLILAEAISVFGEEFIMSVMQMMAQSGDAGDGMSDDINARLSHGEYVIPADAVSHAGDGSTEVGARRLRDMVEELRIAKTGTPNQAPPVQMRGGGLAQYMYNDGGLVESEEEEFIIPPIPESLRRTTKSFNDEVSNEPIPLPGGGFISVEDFGRLPGVLPERLIKKKRKRTYEF